MMWTRESVQAWIKTGIGAPPPVSGGKGDKTAQAAEKQQLAFSQQLQQLFTQQFGQQSAVLNFLRDKMEGGISNPQGYGADTLARMHTAADENVARNIAQARQATNAELASRPGASQLPSGVQEQIDAGLNVAGAGLRTEQQTGIDLSNEQLKQQNYWNSVNGLNGVAAGLNPASLMGGSTSASGAVAANSQANTAAGQVGFFNKFTGALGSSLGNTLGGGNSTSMGSGSAGQWLCWIAAELYGGWYAPKTKAVRRHLLHRSAESKLAFLAVLTYAVCGRTAANLVHRFAFCRRLAHRIFDPIVEKANGAA